MSSDPFVQGLRAVIDNLKQVQEKAQRLLDSYLAASEASASAARVEAPLTSRETTDARDPDLGRGSSGGFGQDKKYLVLPEEERRRSFVRSVRRSYRHVGIRPKYPLRDITKEEQERAGFTYAGRPYTKYEEYPESERPVVGRAWTDLMLSSGCGGVTTMSRALAETYAAKPDFYSATFCASCNKHFRVEEFTWLDQYGRDTNERVGS